MRIDSHQHFWKYDPVRDHWISEEMHKIRQDFMPADLAPLLRKNKIDGCVVVQADQSEQETRFLISLAEQYDFILGVVGWLDLFRGDLECRIDEYMQIGKLKGLRHIVQAEPPKFMLQPKFIKAMKVLYRKDLTYDILTREDQLADVLTMLKVLPEMRIVIDHLSKPDIKGNSFDYWSSQMLEISQYEHIHVKLSGIVTEADWEAWSGEDFRKYIDFCLEHFGPSRLMFGSDWPVCLLAGSFKQVVNALEGNLKELSPSEKAQIWGQTATRFYELN